MLAGSVRLHYYRTKLSSQPSFAECHASIFQSEKRVILADSDIGARIEFSSALTYENVTRNRFLASELFHTQASSR